ERVCVVHAASNVDRLSEIARRREAAKDLVYFSEFAGDVEDIRNAIGRGYRVAIEEACGLSGSTLQTIYRRSKSFDVRVTKKTEARLRVLRSKKEEVIENAKRSRK